MKKIVLATLVIACSFLSLSCGKKEKEEKELPNPAKEVRVIEDNSGAEVEKEDGKPEKKGILIAIDPGHQSFDVDMRALEANAPGSTQMKAKATSGTTGRYSQIPEYQLNMDISLMLKEELERRGYDVLLTRENNDVAISNSERATLANEAGADVSIRIHANGSEDAGVSGALALVPSSENAYVGNLSENSAKLAEQVLSSYCASTGLTSQGVQTNDTMTGINWSKIPVMILEMGYMSNEHDDLQMADGTFRAKMVSGIVEGIEQYYDSKGGNLMSEELNTRIQSVLEQNVAAGEKWAVNLEELTGDKITAQVGNESMEAASLIKLYVAACVYHHIDGVKKLQNYEGETEELLHRMLSASDNEATNQLVKKLGNGDSAEGISKVNAYCSEEGYNQTHMGRLMLDFEAPDTNYTSVSDCAVLLKKVYNGKIKGAENILAQLKQQERRGKIPAGITEKAMVANKTGELDDVESDVAIIVSGETAYTLCVMSQGLSDCPAARSNIQEISRMAYDYVVQGQ